MTAPESRSDLSAVPLDIVGPLLALAALSPTGPELDSLARDFAAQRAALQAMWEVPGTRYGEPALIFQAQPALARWPALGEE